MASRVMAVPFRYLDPDTGRRAGLATKAGMAGSAEGERKKFVQFE
jgi:hypothetical protein